MLSRTNIILAIALVVQIVLSAGMALSSSSTTVRPDEALLKDFSADAVNEVIIADNTGKEVDLKRSEDGWVLPNADDYPAKADQVETVLGKIAGFKTNRLIATNATSHARLEVKDDEFRRKLTLVTDSGSTELYFGTAGGANTTHTRVGGDNNVYLTSGLNSWEIQPQASSWVDATYVNVDQDKVTRLVLTNVSGTFEFERDGENWTYLGLGEGEEFNTTQMSSILRNATNVRMTQPLGLESKDEYGMGDPEIAITVYYQEPVEPAAEATEEAVNTSTDTVEAEATAEPSSTDETAEPATVEKSYSLAIGKPLGNGEYVMKADTKDYYVQVRSSFVTTFRNINHEALLVKQDENITNQSG